MFKCGNKCFHFAVAAILAFFFSAFSAQIAIDVTQKHQTMDGFGFFGPAEYWWSSTNPVDFYSKAWLNLAIDSIGITIWRNEYYSEVGNDPASQDATWAKQKPAVLALKAKADASGVPLKFFFSVWSPPSSFKCAGDNSSWGEPTTTPWSQGLKGGGTLCSASDSVFADWLVAGIKLYSDAGINLYAISMQNEPLFVEGYNSCFYYYDYYASVLKIVGPKVKAAYPNVKLLGAEDMLSSNINSNGASQFPYLYEQAMIDNGTAQYMGVWAYHGYSDGVNPAPTSGMNKCWTVAKNGLASTHKPIWQTEISGYTQTWSDTSTGPMAYWAGIHSGLTYGDMNAWVYWYGANDLISAGTGNTITKLGSVHRHFARFVRPGAVRISASVTGSSIYATAFEDTAKGTFVIEAMNSGGATTVNLTGTNIPAQFTMYQTTATDNCANKGAVSSSSITLPEQSVVTLVNGNVYDSPTSLIPGSFKSVPSSAMKKPSGFITIMYTIDGKRIRDLSNVKSGVYLTATATSNGRISLEKMAIH